MRRTPSSVSIRFALAMVVMCLGFAVLAAPAHAAPPAKSISGTVTDAINGAHIPSIAVKLYTNGGSGWVEYTSVATDYDGAYSFLNVPDNTYRVGFSDPTYGLYVTQYWSGKASVIAANNVIMVGGAPVASINAALARETGTGHGGSVTGLVSAAGSGWELATIRVDLYVDDAGSWNWLSSIYTGTDGRYIFTGLTAGTYAVGYRDDYGFYSDAYYSSELDQADATPIPLAEDGDVRNIDQALSLYPSAIAGTIIDQVTHVPVAAANVYLYRDGGTGYSIYDSMSTSADGRYQFTNLSSGDYKLEYADTANLYYSEYWQDASELDGATPIPLDGSTDVVTNVDAELALGGIISGTVTAEGSGDPIGTGSVTAYRYNDASDAWEYYAVTDTTPSGEYRFTMLPYGKYRVQFMDDSWVYLGEYYNDASGLLDATDITTSITPVTGIDVQLARGGRISGSVLDAGTLAPIAGATVYPYVYDERSGSWSLSSWYSRNTDGSGQFTITGLPFGTYRFCATATNYVTEFYQETLSADAATSIVFTNDTLKTGLNFSPGRSSTLSGRVTNTAGTALFAINVTLYQLRTDYSGIPYWAALPYGANTEMSGDYTITGIPPGTYRVRFCDTYMVAPDYLTEYYSEKPNLWDATSVVIGSGDAITSINASMSVGASISGRVTDATTASLQGVAVRALAYNPPDDDWEPVGASVLTDSSGNYTIPGLPDDVYRLGFAKTNYLTRYFSGANTAFDGTDVTIASGVSQSGKDVQLTAGATPEAGSIIGTVTADATGLGIQWARVVAFRSDPVSNGGWYWANSTETQASGVYSMTAPAGLYRLQFDDGYGRYFSEYFDNATDRADATRFDVAPGATVFKNAGLAEAGSISGTVTGEGAGLPPTSVNVVIYGRIGPDWYQAGSGSMEPDGSYSVGGLKAGSYRVAFGDYSGIFRTEYYNDRVSLESADEILLDTGEDRTGVDVSLKRYGRVIGTVTGDDGRPIDQIRVSLYRRWADYWEFVNSTLSAPDGTYEIGQLPPGDYIVHFQDEGSYGFERYLPEYRTNAAKTADAAVVAVAYGDVTVNETLASTGTWGDISGTVTDSVTGDPIPGIAVCRFDPDGSGGWTGTPYSTPTAADGTYTLQWVPAGVGYRVCADPEMTIDSEAPWSGIYLPTYHYDATTVGAGLPVAVTAGAETPGIDIDAVPEADIGYLSGHIIEDGTGKDVASAHVTLWRYDGSYSNFVELDADATGRFTRPVPAGQYALQFTKWPSHRGEFYQNVSSDSPNDGTPVNVTAAGSTEVTASLEPLGSIAGTVTADNGGLPLEGVSIEVYQDDGAGSWNWKASTYTEDDGGYDVVGLSYGAYQLGFFDQTGDYVDEYYDNKDDLDVADDVTVGPTPTTGIDAGLADAASISGVVTDAATHAGLQSIFVYAYRFDESNGWQAYVGLYTDVGGVYTLDGLPADTYRIGFFDWSTDYADEYYNGVRILNLADDIPVSLGEHVTGLNAEMEKNGSISGTVTDVVTGDPIPNPTVYAYSYRPDTKQWQTEAGVNGDSSGFYTLANLAPGTYRLVFGASNYVTETYHNKYSIWAGDDVIVGSGQKVLGIDEAISKGTTISGTVRNEAGNGIQSVYVSALLYDPWREVWSPLTSVYTRADGTYTLGNLGDYDYRVSFMNASQIYLSEYYDDAATPETGDAVSVSGGVPVASIDATLAPWVAPAQGVIAGTVRADTGGTRIAGVEVTASRWSPEYGQWSGMGTAFTASNGTYALSLPVGTYRLQFVDPSGMHITEYYHDGAESYWDGIDVPVSADATTTIDEGLATAAHIRGTVTAESGGAPLPDVTVSAYKVVVGVGWDWWDSAETATDGTYDLDGLTSGRYMVGFEDASNVYLEEYYDNVTDLGDAVRIGLAAAEVRTGIDAQLATAGIISGTVTNEANGKPIENLRVTLWRDYGSASHPYAYTTTDDLGRYTCEGLIPGTYYVEFTDDWTPVGFERFTDEFYRDAVDLDSATPIAVTNEEEFADAELASTGTWGSIAGTIVDGVTGKPVEGMPVILYHDDGAGFNPDYSDVAYSEADGTYEFPYVPELLGHDPYRLAADSTYDGPWSALYVPTWHSAASTVGGGQDVPLVGGGYLTDIDVNLIRQPGVGWIGGTVTSVATSAKLGGIGVDLYDTDGHWYGSATTLGDGTWGRAVAADSYLIEFSDDAGVYGREWYNNVTTQGLATAVVVADGASQTANASLASAAHIRGEVRDSSGVPLETWVFAYDAEGSNVGIEFSDGGTYGFDGLAAGSYTVWFSNVDTYMGEYWNDRVSHGDDISLVVGQTASSIDATLTAGGHISGTVTSDDGLLANSVYVYFYAETPDGWESTYGTWAYSWDGWTYESPDMLPGHYKVLFSEEYGVYGPLWHDATAELDDAAVVMVGENGDVTVDQVLDGLPPDVNSNMVANYDDQASIEITATDLTSGVASITYAVSGGGSVTVTGSTVTTVLAGWGDYTLDYWATDNVGNMSKQVTKDFTIADTHAPTVVSDAIASYASTATITITGTDGGSGVASVSYRADGGATQTVSAATTHVHIGGIGTHSLVFWAVDVAGNESGHVTANFRIADSVHPTADDDAVLSYNDTAVIHLTATDNIGVDHISYRLDGGSWVEVSGAAATVTVTRPGAHTLAYKAVDPEGNESTVTNVGFTVVDTIHPTAEDDAVASYNDTAAIHLTATDNAGGSGIDYITYQLDGGSWVEVPGAAATVTVTGPGAHALSYKAMDLAGNESVVTDLEFSVVRTKAVTQIAIAGDNRFDTGVAISKKGFPSGAEWVVIATGMNWPDALGGSALAGALDGPILLTETNALTTTVRAEIVRLGAKKAIILGSAVAVGAPVETALKSMLGAANVQRLAGANRYRTADLIGKRTITELGTAFDGTAFVATGANYPDALAAAPLSAGLHWPLFLTKPTGLDAETKVAMAGVKEVLVLGGTTVVSPAIESGLKSTYGATKVTRLAGANRYATAVAVAQYGVTHGLSWNRLAITTGEKFPDALAGGVLQGRDGSVMLLTPSATLNASVASVLTTNKAAIAEVRYLGGTSAVSQAVRNAVAAILK